jgi:hypothetical protein
MVELGEDAFPEHPARSTTATEPQTTDDIKRIPGFTYSTCALCHPEQLVILSSLSS